MLRRSALDVLFYACVPRALAQLNYAEPHMRDFIVAGIKVAAQLFDNDMSETDDTQSLAVIQASADAFCFDVTRALSRTTRRRTWPRSACPSCPTCPLTMR